ncbi:MAG TPA: 2-hydroxyacyl-CoA dehydratase family protein, partial [Candidatus Lokiarchaeia archaeon]
MIKNPYIEKTDKKLIGYYCTYLPEELFHAANLYPFRIRATRSETTELADVYMVRFTCSFVRCTLNLALKGGYDFLDGYAICNSCDHTRRMYEVFDLKVFNRVDFKKFVPRFYVVLPHIITTECFEWYQNEIIELKKRLEECYNINILNKDIVNSIKVYNYNRNLLRKIHDQRIQDSPKISGSEALQISIANNSVPKEIANQELERILEILNDSEGIKNISKRIMLVGSIVDNINFTKMIEDTGALIVSDFLCFGTRNFVDDVELSSDENALEDISRRLFYKISCPRMMNDHDRRLDLIKKEIKSAKIDGIILQRINNCDLSGCDNMLLEHELKELDVPVLNIDRESFQTDTT